MAEVIGLLASIGQLSGYILKACDCIDRIKHAPSEKATINREASLLFTLLTRLQQRVELKNGQRIAHMDWLTHVQRLRPALNELKSDLEDLVQRSSRNRLLWPWDDKKCQKTLDRIERLKSAIQIELQESLTNLVDERLKIVAEDIQILRQSQEGVWWDRLRKWFPHAGSSRTQQEVFEQRQPGTGSWLLQHSTFLSWMAGKGAVLWCHGIPGAGKTVMSSIIVDRLVEIHQHDKSVAVICLYFDYRDAQDQVRILNDIFMQLLHHRGNIPEQVQFLIDKWQRKDSQPTNSDLKDLILSELSSHSRIFLVVDAFDECMDLPTRDELEGRQDQFQRTVFETLRSLSPHINLLITSRVSGSLPDLFKDCAQLEIEAHENDMRAYIEHRIHEGGEQYKWTKICLRDTSFRINTINTIMEKAQKMFLLVRLHTDTLNTQDKVKDVERALKNLPTRLYDTYDQAIARIRAQSEVQRLRAEKVLAWITYALRPLSVDEVRHAEATSPSEFVLDQRDVEDIESLVSCCAGLITVDPIAQVVRFVHYTTQQYFQDHRHEHFPNGDSAITKVCLTYLQLADIEDNLKPWGREKLHETYPLIGYSACYWGIHANRIGVQSKSTLAPLNDEEIYDLAISLLEKKTRVSDEFYTNPDEQDMGSIPAPQRPEWQLSKGPHGLHIAAGFGLNVILKHLLQAGADPNIGDDSGFTPLHKAVVNDRRDTVRLLVCYGAEINSKTSWRSLTPLICAAATDRTEIARYLLEKGADTDAECTGFLADSTAMFEACWIGHVEILRLLLKHGAKCRFRPEQITEYMNGRCPMSAAASLGRNEAIGLLKAHGVSLEGLQGYLAMQEALRTRRLSTLSVLVDNGAQIGFTPYGERTIMHIACESGSWAIVKYLVRQQFGMNTSEPEIEGQVMKEFTSLPWFKEIRTFQARDQPSQEADASISIQRFKRDRLCDYNLWSDPSTYFGFFVPPNIINVQKVVFRVDSHDQGKCESWEFGSYTFFEASVQNPSFGERYLERPIFYNEKQNAAWQLKTCVWTRNDEDDAIASSIRDLSPGHIIQVRPKARRPGWVNYVRSCEVEIHYFSAKTT